MSRKEGGEKQSNMEGGSSCFSLHFGQIVPQLHLQNLHQQHHQQQQTIDYSRLTSFLEYDDSFLSVWNWKSIDDDDVNSSSHREESRPRYIEFQPGSLFNHDVFDLKLEYMKFEQLLEKASTSTKICDYEEVSNSTEINNYEEALSSKEIGDYEEVSSSTEINNYEEALSSKEIDDYEETSSSIETNDFKNED
ncbi:hypothetical protein PVL29_017997 [Vitis rotundifolia]|uniref:Uncharacterized protein n=1 Tax=Vitis rotundifolia TaxID=103349 RepID=A0AA39DFK6_VITRO|nr:hypothetical protein PVL29_017997 [Vitis rotundifolia]